MPIGHQKHHLNKSHSIEMMDIKSSMASRSNGSSSAIPTVPHAELNYCENYTFLQIVKRFIKATLFMFHRVGQAKQKPLIFLHFSIIGAQ